MGSPLPFQRILTAAALAALLSTAGCVVPNGAAFNREFQIDGGKTVNFLYENGGVVVQEDQDVRMRYATFRLDEKARTIAYLFDFHSLTGKNPRRVVVEDVSGPGTEILVEDLQPVLQKGEWLGVSGTKVAGDPHLDWLNEPDETGRVYRFTVTTSDGRVSVLYHVCLFSTPFKEGIRKALGIVKPPADPAPAVDPSAAPSPDLAPGPAPEPSAPAPAPAPGGN